MSEYNMIFFYALEPLHNGAGEGIGLIDRPIAREKITQFPIIQPSSIKGVLRDAYKEKWKNNPDYFKVLALFGPEPQHGESHSGALSFCEGQLFAFPIRSLNGCFVWATSPLILFRFKERISTVGFSLGALDPLLKKLATFDRPMICEGSEDLLLVGPPPMQPNDPDRREMMLEEFGYEVHSSLELKKFAHEVAGKIFDASSYAIPEFSKKLIILPEDSFRYFAVNATEVMPNIRIGNEGVTEEGSLRYTEYLPRESILYSMIIYEKARIPTKEPVYDIAALGLDEALKVKRNFEASPPPIIQIGGDETTGKGFVRLKLAM